MNPHPHFDEAERKAVYRVIAERRDVRRGFLDALVADDLIGRLLTAAHSAPSGRANAAISVHRDPGLWYSQRCPSDLRGSQEACSRLLYRRAGRTIFRAQTGGNPRSTA